MWHVWETGEVHTVFVGRAEGKKPLGRLRGRWEDNTSIYRPEDWWGGMAWIGLFWIRTETGSGHL